MDLRPIAITGSIAGGKSTLVGFAAELGLRTASSDAISREIFPLPEIQEALAVLLDVPPPVPRELLRERMAESDALRRAVNRLMHPRVGEHLKALRVDVVEVPLLYEACLQGRYREVWVAACGAEERRRRLVSRYGPQVKVESLMRWQLSETVKCGLADVVIRTNEPLEAVKTTLFHELARLFPARIAHSE